MYKPSTDRPKWYVTEYLNRFEIQLLTEDNKAQEEEDEVVFHGPFETMEIAIAWDKEAPYCAWTWSEEGAWATSCGNLFVLNDGTPKENGMNYCCYCGKKLKEDY
jgi:hypothetical protein